MMNQIRVFAVALVSLLSLSCLSYETESFSGFSVIMMDEKTPVVEIFSDTINEKQIQQISISRAESNIDREIQSVLQKAGVPKGSINNISEVLDANDVIYVYLQDREQKTVASAVFDADQCLFFSAGDHDVSKMKEMMIDE